MISVYNALSDRKYDVVLALKMIIKSRFNSTYIKLHIRYNRAEL